MSDVKFRCPRLLDSQIIEALRKIADDCKLPHVQIGITLFEGANERVTVFNALEDDVQKVIDFHGSTISRFALYVPYQNRNFSQLVLTRKNTEYFDEVLFPRSTDQKKSDLEFMTLVAAAKRELKEIKIEGNLAGIPDKTLNEYYAARDATLTRLETVSGELLIDFHKKQQLTEAEISRRTEAVKAEHEALKQTLRDEYAAKEAALQKKEEELANRAAEFETKESKYLRRDLRKALLTELAERSKKFSLTDGTRHLRWPIVLTMLAFIGFCATMVVLNYTQTAALLETTKDDLSKINPWTFGFLGLKQLGFVAAFLGGVWYFIRWNDRWFRQHADAEFMFKQMELDVNRASWVIETALEWRSENKAELPPELLEPIAHNLFRSSGEKTDCSDAPIDLPTMLFGASSSMTIKGPNGVEFNLDRKGLKKLLSQMPDKDA